MKYTKISTLLLATALILASCGSGGQNEPKVTDSKDTSSSSDTTVEETGYKYPDVDYGGYEFRVLNFDKYVNCTIRVDETEQTGEKLSDAIYNRNRKVEEKLGFRMKEIQHTFTSWGAAQSEILTLVSNSVMAGDDQYDAAYLNLRFGIGLITDGNLVDLKSIDTLKLDEDYWDHVINDSLTINNHLYGASGPLMLESSDFAWCMFFNETMMTNYKMEYPYQLVRDGKWTIDKLNEYVAGAANLNGDESFTNWNANGKCVYGIAGHDGSPQAFIYTAGCDYMKNIDGKYKLTIESDAFYSVVDKMKTLFNLDSGYVRFDNSAKGIPEGYIEMFANGRAMFMTGELKTAMEERDMKDSFGILPMPKLDESQDGYRSLINDGSALLCIPVTNPDLERSGVILDALTYESSETVLPVYYDVTVSQKGLRNDDSIDMLKIIREGRGIDIASFLSVNSEMKSAINNLVCKGGTDEPASIIATSKARVEKNIETIMAAFGE